MLVTWNAQAGSSILWYAEDAGVSGDSCPRDPQDGIGGNDDTRHLRNVWAWYTRDAPQVDCGSIRKNRS